MKDVENVAFAIIFRNAGSGLGKAVSIDIGRAENTGIDRNGRIYQNTYK